MITSGDAVKTKEFEFAVNTVTPLLSYVNVGRPGKTPRREADNGLTLNAKTNAASPVLMPNLHIGWFSHL